MRVDFHPDALAELQTSAQFYKAAPVPPRGVAAVKCAVDEMRSGAQ